MGVREAVVLALASEYNQEIEELEEALDDAHKQIHDMELEAANTDDDDDSCEEKFSAPRAPSSCNIETPSWCQRELSTTGKILAGCAIAGAIAYGVYKLCSDD